MTFNIGVIIGPILGGILSDPAGSYPDIFGDFKFFQDFPYATPNILSAFFLFCAVVSVWLNLEEVSCWTDSCGARVLTCSRPWTHGGTKETLVSKLGRNSLVHCEHAPDIASLLSNTLP